MSEDVKVIMGAGQGFDCLTVKSEPCDKVDGYSSITSVVNTLAIDDFQDEMPCPDYAILIKDSYLRDLESEQSYNDAMEDSEEDEVSELLGALLFVKTVVYNDIEMSLVAYEKGIHITCFAVENGIRSVIGNKFFDLPANPYEDIDKWTEGQVIKSSFNTIESYDDAARFIRNYIFDEETIRKFKEGFVSEDTSVTFVENAWELKENEDGQEEDK